MIGAVGSIGRLMTTTALTRFVGALDGLQSAAAFSTRRLYSNYTGACMRVRRTSENAEADIGFRLYASRAYPYWLDEEALLQFTGSNRNILGGVAFSSWTRDGTSNIQLGAAANSVNQNTAIKIFENSASSPHYFNYASQAGLSPNKPFFFSIEAKAGERTQIRIATEIGAVNSGSTVFDLQSGSVVSGSGTITPLGSGWYRCGISFIASPSASLYLPRVYFLNAAGSDNYAGDGASGAYFDRAMLTYMSESNYSDAPASYGFIPMWYDQSGNERHAIQTVAALQPRIVNAGVVETENGFPTVVFNNSMLKSVSYTISQLHCVAQWRGALPFPSNRYPGLVGFDGQSNLIFGIPGSSTNIGSALFGSWIRINGSVTSSGNPALLRVLSVVSDTGSFTGPFEIGRGDNTQNTWAGAISEVVAFSNRTALEVPERSQGAAFGITVA